MRRVARECAEKTYGPAARAVNEDWDTSFEGRDLQRWVRKFGLRLKAERDAEAAAFESGQAVPSPENHPRLLAIQVDAGKVQLREANPESGSRWRDDKVATIISYLPGDGADREPEPLVTTHVGTMDKTEPFGRLVRVEAQRRGYRYAAQVIALADCGNWIDPLLEREFPGIVRIADWAHAEEHLHDCGRAVAGPDAARAKAFSEPLVRRLWEGGVEGVVSALREAAAALGPAQAEDGPEHPRRVLSRNVGYFETNKAHMKYPEYRKKGWPVGSGGVEAGVKQFNKRVKGTEQFWEEEGVEAMLCLRGLLLCQDGRWERYWSSRPAYRKRAA